LPHCHISIAVLPHCHCPTVILPLPYCHIVVSLSSLYLSVSAQDLINC
jgi:hypothetical protein